MTQSALRSAIARSTGESPRTLRSLGFNLLPSRPGADLEPEELCLVLDCPFCGHAVAYPGRTSGGELTLAECDGCDVFFDFEPDEVYATGQIDPPPAVTEAA